MRPERADPSRYPKVKPEESTDHHHDSRYLRAWVGLIISFLIGIMFVGAVYTWSDIKWEVTQQCRITALQQGVEKECE